MSLEKLKAKLLSRLSYYEERKRDAKRVDEATNYGIKSRTLKEVLQDIDLLKEKAG